ncbi:MAG TPA: TonB-dependent receptor plug domain-containing protein [Lacunisphaera sp.]|nr:TonB-dependent receptor plug domain-containing protein [Lacunisphaera sp.]
MKIHSFTLATRRLQALLSGVLICVAIPASAQQASQPAAAPETTSVPVETSQRSVAGDKVLELSPFQVTAAGSDGYRATATMSGTRLKTNLDDLAASISVVTKQQLEDTASVDINDIFKYELSTEGTSQWTDFNVDRGNVTDNVSREPSSANRMRGLTSANLAQDGFGVYLPLDTYNVDAVEISRGPNSTVFGLGNTGGGVNIIRGRANAQRDATTVATRGDSYDGYRGSFDVNRALIQDKLALRLFGLYEDKGYVRKPSEDLTRRLNLVTRSGPSRTRRSTRASSRIGTRTTARIRSPRVTRSRTGSTAASRRGIPSRRWYASRTARPSDRSCRAPAPKPRCHMGSR